MAEKNLYSIAHELFLLLRKKKVRTRNAILENLEEINWPKYIRKEDFILELVLIQFSFNSLHFRQIFLNFANIFEKKLWNEFRKVKSLRQTKWWWFSFSFVTGSVIEKNHKVSKFSHSYRGFIHTTLER